MKKNGYLRKFIAMFLVFVMLMADSSMTTFADVVGRSVQQNADQSADQSVAVQSEDDDTGNSGNIQVSRQYISQSLGMATNFMVVAEKFTSTDHYEGNIAVDNYIHRGTSIGASNN